MIKLDPPSISESTNIDIGSVVLCKPSVVVYSDSSCKQNPHQLSDVHPSCIGIVLNLEGAFLSKVFFAPGVFSIVLNGQIINYNLFKFLQSDKITSDLCRYFTYICTSNEDNQFQLFEETKNLNSKVMVLFDEKNWDFEIQTNYPNLNIIQNYYKSNLNTFPEIEEYFGCLGPHVAKYKYAGRFQLTEI